MCGNCGWFTQRDTDLSNVQRGKRTRVTEGLLVANSHRGTDATGIGIVDAAGVTTVYKKAKSSIEFVDMPKAQRIARKEEAMILIGHTRLGTMGANIDKNAHPFQEGPVLGAHNGIIWNHYELDDLVKGTQFPKPSRVDSQAAFRILATMEDPEDALSLIEGDAALIWHDRRRPDQLNIVRHGNPLSLAWVDRIKTLFWSSQFDHLAPALYAAFGGDWWSITAPEDELFTFHADDVMNYDSKKVKFAESYGYGSYGKGGGFGKGWKRSSSGGAWTKDDSKARATSPQTVSSYLLEMGIGTKDADDEVVDGRYIDECDICHSSIEADDLGAGWVTSSNDGSFLCGRCKNWWESEGEGYYDSVVEAADIADKLIRSGRDITDAKSHEIPVS